MIEGCIETVRKATIEVVLIDDELSEFWAIIAIDRFPERDRSLLAPGLLFWLDSDGNCWARRRDEA